MDILRIHGQICGVMLTKVDQNKDKINTELCYNSFIHSVMAKNKKEKDSVHADKSINYEKELQELFTRIGERESYREKTKEHLVE